MQNTAKVLKRVKEKFNIFNDGRLHNPAPQKFLLSALKSVLKSPITQERVSLNEAVGFYGHGLREKTKINPSEVETIMVNDKPLLVNVVPAVRTVSVDIDDDGNVTHEQEFLDNDLGKAALALYEQGTGGFSWAMSGSDGRGQPSITRSFSGFDYVLQPNFLPTDRAEMLLSSMNDSNEKILSSLVSSGFNQDEAEKLLSSISAGDSKHDDINELIISHLSLERDSLLTAKKELIEKDQAREKLLSSVIDSSPFLINEAQKQSLLRMSCDDDAITVKALFSSMAQTDMSQYPQGNTTFNESVEAETKSAPAYHSFDSTDKRTFKKV